MDLQQLRVQIDAVDEELVRLFVQRMDLSAQVAAYKKQTGVPIFVPAREREKLADVMKQAGPEMENYTRVLYSLLFELSRSYQHKCNNDCSPLSFRISQAIQNTPQLLPCYPQVACLGVEGAYSQIACEKIFCDPMIRYFQSFEDVFRAVEEGTCQYGVLPVENSIAGSVNKVYDLMSQYNFSIVRTLRMKVDHCLLVNPGVKLSEIREIVSHEQVLNQCTHFLRTLDHVSIQPVVNTAVAAQMVATTEPRDLAALSSRAFGMLYGLDCPDTDVQDRGNNRTRYICISKELEIYPGSDRTSIMMVLDHKPGSLYKVLARLYTLGINVTRLESRPIPDRDLEFMFYFDLDASVCSEGFLQLMCELDGMCESFKYLGSYSEVI